MARSRAQWPTHLQDWIGFTITEESDYTVESGLILNWLDAMRDGNPIYWNEKVAHEVSDGIVAPPPMTLPFSMSPRWSPKRPGEIWDMHETETDYETAIRMPMEAHFALKEFTGLREGIVAAIESEFYEPLRLGDRLTVASAISGIGEERKNRLGIGRNWIVEVTFSNQRGDLVSIEKYHFFCYNRDGES